ncbi:penicillin acylase family protein [Bradymonas sediminis]|uniref:Penicillin acylase family protein n=1 Tax=Bradymonas sediminis TaxID=1548548 RepID=A0A2Z4FIY5_9DELT|nr:penicillin acylase family protein [Bradymonas sediminis]AWV88883.1 hypothetical protein DN745_05835 [Bradymonas sediminis]
MMRNYLLRGFILCGLALAGCSEGSNQRLPNHDTPHSDAGRDASSSPEGDAQLSLDAGPTSDADASNPDIDLAPDPLVGDPDIRAQLRRPVKVMTDAFGMHHIFAESLEDLFFINGYTYASDRFAQMEFYRRLATGTLAEIWGDASVDARRSDVMMRSLGLKRSAERYLRAEYDPDSQSSQALMAYCAGVNAFLAKYRAGEVALPGGMAEAMPPHALPDWQPADVMAVSKLLALYLSYSAPTWIEWHGLRQKVLDTFAPDAPSGDFAARHGFLADVLRLAPAAHTTHIDGLPAGNSSAIILPNTSSAQAPDVSPKLIERALALHEGLDDLEGMGELDIFGRRGALKVGGNSWVLGGELTESGNPTVANDPHLGLGLPTIFYPIHMELNDDIDGRAPLKLVGAALMGLPGVALGRSDAVAWGASASQYDYSDVYAEEVRGDSDAAEIPTVLFEGLQVPVERITETIKVGSAGEVSETLDLVVEVVPHHGPILPTLEDGRPLVRRSGQALSVKWAGLRANNEMDFLMGLWRAKTPLEAEAALNQHGVGFGNFVFGFSSGQIFYSGQSDIARRQVDALNYHPRNNPRGNAPIFILPGSGGAEWSGLLDDRRIPHAYNPQKRFIVIADNDPTGGALNNNPFDELYYIGAFFDVGFRAERITSLIESATAFEQTLSVDAQMAIQHDAVDPLAERVAQRMVNAIDVVTTASLHGSDDEEVNVLLDLYAGRIDVLVEYRDLLDAWDYAAPATRSPTGPDRGRSAAASLFNAAMVELLKAVYADEFDKLGYFAAGEFRFAGASQLLIRSLVYLLEQPEAAQTYDPSLRDSRIFDDLRTPNLDETRLSALVHSVVRAADRFARSAALGEALGRAIPSPGSASYSDWVWGRMHGVALAASLPTPSDTYARPGASARQPFFGHGGAEFSIKRCPHGFNDFNFSCDTGAAVRMLHVMNAGDSVSYIAIPGGYSGDPASPFYMSEFDGWRGAPARKVEINENLLDANGAGTIVYAPY